MPTVPERYNFPQVESDGGKFIQEAVKLCLVNCVDELSQDTVDRYVTKGDLAEIFVRALQLIERQHNMVINLRVQVGSCKTDVIKLQEQVISTQEQVITAKEVGEKFRADVVDSVLQEMKSVRKSVKSVKKSVRSVKKSVLQSVQKSNGVTVNNSSASVPLNSLTSVEKRTDVEEEPSRNDMICGWGEDGNEELCYRANEALCEEPRIELSRLGKKYHSAVCPAKDTR